jgi:hypothetical protein
MAEKVEILASDTTDRLYENIGESKDIHVSKTQWSDYVSDDEWREKTCFDSSIGDPDHRCYDKIVKLGFRAVPFIINKLKEEPSFILAALIRITGENPIKEENRGIVKKMADDWINWWEKKNAAGCSNT